MSSRIRSLIASCAVMMLCSCSSTPTFCECRFGMVEKMSEVFIESQQEGAEVNTEELEEMSRKCKEAYGNLTASQQLELLKDCE